MSATDWYICPRCREKAIKYIDSWYGKIDVKLWEVLSKFRQAWEDEDTNFKIPEKAEETFDAIREKYEDFEESEFIMEDTIVTVRYDSDTGINIKDEILYMNESYDCQHCDFNIHVEKQWAEGTNKEAVKKK